MQPDFKGFIKPTPLKFFFPVLFAILIAVSYSINSRHLPSLGEGMCNAFTALDEFASLSSNLSNSTSGLNSSDAKALISGAREKLGKPLQSYTSSLITVGQEHAKPVVLGNSYFILSGAYKLDPFFPTPCEFAAVSSIAKIDIDSVLNNNCGYYMTEKSYKCINDFNSKLNTHIGTSNLPEYRPISLGNIVLHSIILILIVYLIACIMSYLLKTLSQARLLYKFLTLAFMLTIPLLVIIAFKSLAALVLYPFAILFSSIAFVRNDKARAIVLIILAVLFVIILVAGVVIANLAIDQLLIKTGEQLSRGIEKL